MAPLGDICTGRDSLQHFLDTYEEESGKKHIQSQLPIPMYEEVAIPKLLGQLLGENEFLFIWFF